MQVTSRRLSPVQVLLVVAISALFAGDVQKSVSPVQQSEVDEQKKQAAIEQHDSIVSQYKELIREQVRCLRIVCSFVSCLLTF